MTTTSIAIAKSGLKTSLIEALYNEILTNSNSYYYFLGKTLPFGEEDALQSPSITPIYESAVRNDIIFMKKITSADISYVVPRYDWVANTVFDMYDDAIDSTNPSSTGATSLETSKFYCMNSDYHVYKCLNNNGGAQSTVEPYGTSYKLLKLSDGYTWKYMYTVPISSRNKFMTDVDIPVTTAIKNQYYSRGSITSAIITAYGNGYAVGDSLGVFGNGYLENNPLKINSVAIDNEGAGYVTAPEITFADAYDNVAFELDTEYISGRYLKHGNNIYEVISAGTTDAAVYPTHTTADPVYNGTAALKYVATTPTGTTEITAGAISQINLSGIVGYINITNPGYGYTSVPIVTISGTHTVLAEGSAIIANTRVIGVEITNRGTDYETATVAFDAPMTQDAMWSSAGIVSVNDIIKTTDNNYYKVVSGTDGVDIGTDLNLGTSKPIHTGGTATNGEVVLEFVGAQAVGTVEIYFGYGYGTPPTITVDMPPITEDAEWASGATVALGDILKTANNNYYEVTNIDEGTTLGTAAPTHTTGTEVNGDVELDFIGADAVLACITSTTSAKLVPVIENGQIVSVISSEPGVGYTTASIVVSSDTGSGAVITPNISFGDINTNQANIELLATPGTVDAIVVTDGGTGYSFATITIDGDGTGATAEAVIIDGVITKINMLTHGTGYTKTTVTISGNGDGAVARAIVSPANGHGSNAVTELFATDITLFSSISSEKNQGFTVANDYRQLGIIKNPQNFAVATRFNTNTGSTCFLVAVNSPTVTILPNDSLIVDDDDHQYRIVASSVGLNTSTILLQSLDNEPLTINKNLYYTDPSNTVKTLTVTNFTDPEVNKYSGNLLFIDNRNAFIPSAEQTISIKTAIRL